MIIMPLCYVLDSGYTAEKRDQIDPGRMSSWLCWHGLSPRCGNTLVEDPLVCGPIVFGGVDVILFQLRNKPRRTWRGYLTHELLIFDPADDFILSVLYLLFIWIYWHPATVNRATKQNVSCAVHLCAVYHNGKISAFRVGNSPW